MTLFVMCHFNKLFNWKIKTLLCWHMLRKCVKCSPRWFCNLKKTRLLVLRMANPLKISKKTMILQGNLIVSVAPSIDWNDGEVDTRTGHGDPIRNIFLFFSLNLDMFDYHRIHVVHISTAGGWISQTPCCIFNNYMPTQLRTINSLQS